MGKNSEVTWMQRLESDTTRQGEDSLEAPPQYLLRSDDSIASMNYRLDHDRLSIPEVRNAFVLPPKALADQLFQIYFDKVHYSIPIIRQNLFMEQYNRLFSESPINPGRKWLAIFNMVLAISSRFCRYSKQGAQGDADENMFFARAKCLSISENVLYDHEDLQQVQAEALMGFYFLAVSQINRYGFQKSCLQRKCICARCLAFLTNPHIMENDRNCRTFGHRIRTQPPTDEQQTRFRIK